MGWMNPVQWHQLLLSFWLEPLQTQVGQWKCPAARRIRAANLAYTPLPRPLGEEIGCQSPWSDNPKLEGPRGHNMAQVIALGSLMGGDQLNFFPAQASFRRDQF